MKHLLIYLVHGEDIPRRLFLGLVSVGALVGSYGIPQTGPEWGTFLVVFLTGSASKNEEQARKQAIKAVK